MFEVKGEVRYEREKESVCSGCQSTYLALVDIGGGGVLEEQTADESTVRGDTGTGGNHDVVGVGVLLRHEHDLTGRAGHLQLISRRGVAEEVRADSLLGGVLGLELGAPVGGTADAERSGLAGHVISVPRGGDGVKSDGVGLSVLLAGARGDDTPRLSLDVGEVTLVVDDDVASLTGGLGADDALGGDDLSGEGRLVLVRVDLHVRVVIVRGVLKEVLLQVQGGSGREREKRDETHACNVLGPRYLQMSAYVCVACARECSVSSYHTRMNYAVSRVVSRQSAAIRRHPVHRARARLHPW